MGWEGGGKTAHAALRCCAAPFVDGGMFYFQGPLLGMHQQGDPWPQHPKVGRLRTGKEYLSRGGRMAEKRNGCAASLQQFAAILLSY